MESLALALTMSCLLVGSKPVRCKGLAIGLPVPSNSFRNDIKVGACSEF